MTDFQTISTVVYPYPQKTFAVHFFLWSSFTLQCNQTKQFADVFSYKKSVSLESRGIIMVTDFQTISTASISTEDVCCTFFLWSSFTLQCNQTNNLLTFFPQKVLNLESRGDNNGD